MINKEQNQPLRQHDVSRSSIDDVFGRMYNWKMESAYEIAKEVNGFPKEALSLLKKLSDKFGNCGWQDGKIFDKLRDGNNNVAKILGYEWDDDRDWWVMFKNCI